MNLRKLNTRTQRLTPGSGINRKYLVATITLLASVSCAQEGTAQSPSNQIYKPARRMDLSKSAIELPLKRIIKSEGTPIAPHRPDVSPEPAPLAVAKDRVTPGLVSWHKDMMTAMDAASKSGKPLLVFHMMGSLDDRFC